MAGCTLPGVAAANYEQHRQGEDPLRVATPGPGSADRRWAVLGLAVAAVAFGSSSATLLAPLAPFLVEAFALQPGEVGLATSAFFTGTAALSLYAGWLNDRFGVRAALGAGLTLVGLVMLAASQAQTFGILIAGLFAAGLGYSTVIPATTKALVDWFPPGQRARVVALNLAAYPVAGALTSAIVPQVALAADWRAAVASVAPFPLLCGVAVLATYRRPPLSVSSASLSAGHVRSGSVRHVLFHPRILAVTTTSVLLGMQQASLVSFFVLFFQRERGWPVALAGGLLGLLQLSGLAARIGVGQLGDTLFLRQRSALLAGCALLASAGCLALAAAPGLLNVPLAVLVALVAGAGSFGWTSIATIMAAEQAGPARSGLATAMPTTGLFVGWVLGPIVTGLAITMSGFNAAWLVAALLGIVGTLPLMLNARGDNKV